MLYQENPKIYIIKFRIGGAQSHCKTKIMCRFYKIALTGVLCGVPDTKVGMDTPITDQNIQYEVTGI